ncbi:hypothetical protein [Acidithiobacillus thiooxidans]|uniref:hypothetical protein n=1 Tax=Acidithiobacillus thiooxidans TaxID=930 RepID=UPI003564206F|nr:hypothetical protein [Acidithiobacillus sp.]
MTQGNRCKSIILMLALALITINGWVLWRWLLAPEVLPITNHQMAAAIRSAGKGQVHLVQILYDDGVFGALVAYPNHSRHVVYFLRSGHHIIGIATGKAWQLDGHALAPRMLVSDLKAVSTAAPHPVAYRADVRMDHQKILNMLPYAQGFVWAGTHHDETPVPVIDAFVDPNCLFCHRWFEHEKPLVEKGRVAFRIIPVGALKPSSPIRAAEILSAPDPLALWVKNENGFKASTETGGIPLTLTQIPKMKKAVAVNTAILYHIDGKKPFTPSFASVRTGQVWIGVDHTFVNTQKEH